MIEIDSIAGILRDGLTNIWHYFCTWKSYSYDGYRDCLILAKSEIPASSQGMICSCFSTIHRIFLVVLLLWLKNGYTFHVRDERKVETMGFHPTVYTEKWRSFHSTWKIRGLFWNYQGLSRLLREDWNLYSCKLCIVNDRSKTKLQDEHPFPSFAVVIVKLRTWEFQLVEMVGGYKIFLRKAVIVDTNSYLED